MNKWKNFTKWIVCAYPWAVALLSAFRTGDFMGYGEVLALYPTFDTGIFSDALEGVKNAFAALGLSDWANMVAWCICVMLAFTIYDLVAFLFRRVSKFTEVD